MVSTFLFVIGRFEAVLLRSLSHLWKYDEGRTQASDSAVLFVQVKNVSDLFFVAFEVQVHDSLAD